MSWRLALAVAPVPALTSRLDQMIQAAAWEPVPACADGRVTLERCGLYCIRVEENVLRIKPELLVLLLEAIGWHEPAAGGESVDDLLLTLIVVCIKLHAEVVELPKRPADGEHNGLEGIPQGLGESQHLAAFDTTQLFHLWRVLAVLVLYPPLNQLDGAGTPRVPAQCRDRVRVSGQHEYAVLSILFLSPPIEIGWQTVGGPLQYYERW